MAIFVSEYDRQSIVSCIKSCSLYTPLVSLTSVKTIADKSMSAVETTMTAQPSPVSVDLQTPAHYEESTIFSKSQLLTWDVF